MPSLIAGSRIRRSAARGIPYRYPFFGLGHEIDVDPYAIMPGKSIRTYDVNLDTMGGAPQRGGIKYLSENPACSQQIVNGSEAFTNSTSEQTVSGQAQAGGVATITLALADTATITDQYKGRTIRLTGGTGQGQSATITAHNFTTDVCTVTPAWPGLQPNGTTLYTIDPLARSRDADGTALTARRITNSGAVTTDAIATLATALDLGTDTTECIGLWIYLHDVTLTSTIIISLINTAGANFFRKHYATLAEVDAAFNTGWNFISVRKDDFESVVAPVWTDIKQVFVRFTSTAASYMTFDNFWVGPAYLKGLFNWTRSPVRGGGSFYLAAGRGKISIYIPEENYWKELSSGQDPDNPIHFFAINDHVYAMDGVSRPKLITGTEPADVYTAGIDPPVAASTINITALGGSVLAGLHTYAYVFFSTITGRESNPFFGDPFTVADDNSLISHTNLPVSADPKVTHLRIFRLAPGQAGYRRVDENLEGTVANGVTVYPDSTLSSELGAFLEGANNYDLNGVPPNAAVGAVVNNVVIYDDPAEPGRVKVSRPGSGEQVPLDGSVPLDEGDNDTVQAIVDAFGFAVVFKQDSFYVGRFVDGIQPFSFQKKSNTVGSVSHRGVAISEDVIRWRHVEGYYEMNLSWLPNKISRGWDRRSLLPLAEPSVRDFDTSNGQLVTAAFNTSRDQVLWTETVTPNRYPSILTVLHETLQHLDDGTPSGWAFHRPPISIITTVRDALTHEERILGGGDCGIVYLLDQDRPNDTLITGDVAIDMDYMTPFLDQSHERRGIGPDVLKIYKYLDMMMRPGGNWPIDYELFFDWATFDVQAVVNGLVVAASSNTVTLPATARNDPDYYTGYYAEIVDGPGVGEPMKKIIEYSATRVATIEGAWTTTPTTASIVVVRKRPSAVGQLAPSSAAGAPIGIGFVIGQSAIGGAGGDYQRAVIENVGRKRSIAARFRNDRLDQAPYIGSFELYCIPRRGPGSNL